MSLSFKYSEYGLAVPSASLLRATRFLALLDLVVFILGVIRSRGKRKKEKGKLPTTVSAVEELYGTRYQSGSFSLINVGSGFHCLRSIFFFLSTRLKTS